MRQIVSLIKDDQVQYALVDEDDGSLVPFASITLPDPDRFGLHEAAVLGTNLINALALGLNGTKRPKATIPSVGAVEPAEGRIALAPPEPPVGTETARERRNRIARERYHSYGKTKTENHAKRYITLDEVLAVVADHPEGIRVPDIAERLWRTTDGQGTDEGYPNWFYTAVSNRLTSAREKLKTHGTPLPFAEDRRPLRNKDGSIGAEVGAFIKPLSAT